MRTGKNAPRRRRAPAPTDRSVKEVAELVVRSLVHAMRVVRRLRGRCSQPEVARWIGKSLSYVQKGLAGKLALNPLYILRSRWLARPFALHLCQLVAVRNGRVT